MTNDKPKDHKQALQAIFNEALSKASKERIHAICIGDFLEQDENGHVKGELIISGNSLQNAINRDTAHLLLRALYGIFYDSTPEEKEDFLTDFLHFYLLLATDGNEDGMEKVEDILTDVLCKAAGAVEISLHPRTKKKN